MPVKRIKMQNSCDKTRGPTCRDNLFNFLEVSFQPVACLWCWQCSELGSFGCRL